MNNMDQNKEDLIKEIQHLKERIGQLELNEERYRTIIETVPHGIQEIDSLGTITFSNKAHAEMHGYATGELVGRNVSEMLAEPEDRKELALYLAELVSKQPVPTTYESVDRCKDGSLIDVRVDWDYKRDEQGAVIGFVAVLTDVTDRKKEQLRVERLSEELAVYDKRLKRLTPREREVMMMVTDGKPNKQIGEELDISPRTVEIHRKRVMDKMEVGSLAELVRYITVSKDLL